MRAASLLFLTMLIALLAVAPSTQPADLAAVELRAHQAFTRGEYATALPLLQKLATDYKGQPDKLGAIQEQINVCQKAITAANAQQGQPGEADPAMAAETRKPHSAPKSGEIITLTIKELGNFEYDADRGGNIP